MGLDLYAHGCTVNFHLSYGSFGAFRRHIAYLYDTRLGEIYTKSYNFYSETLSEEEENYIENIYKKEKGLECFLNHSDCDGILTYNACKHLLNTLNKLDVSKLSDEWYASFIDFKEIAKYCAKYKKRLYFY